MIKVLRARKLADEARQSAIDQLQRAIDWAKSHGNIDQVLVNRAMRTDAQIEDLDKFGNATVDLRKSLISAIKEAVKND